MPVRSVFTVVCPACRYNNKPWGDCDPVLLLRTKHVSLVKDSRYSDEDCLETREFSKTCSAGDLTQGLNYNIRSPY